MEELYYPEWQIRRILRDTDTIAMVGASTNWNRPSYFAMKYLQTKGFRIIPVNPGAAGQELLGEMVYANLKDIPEPIEMVDIFQRSDRVPPIVDDAIEIGAKIIWMQLTVRNDEAAKKAEDAGLTVIMDRCPKIEFGRFSGELGWSGINTRVLTSRRSKQIRAH
ncbi:MAG: O-acetylhomoserine (thiol)-lyase [Alphaproteobacteria bacterium]|jgi:O-acetylhomoserine (thiol)-lyase